MLKNELHIVEMHIFTKQLELTSSMCRISPNVSIKEFYIFNVRNISVTYMAQMMYIDDVPLIMPIFVELTRISDCQFMSLNF